MISAGLDRLARRKVTLSRNRLDADGVGCFQLVSGEFTLCGNWLVFDGVHCFYW